MGHLQRPTVIFAGIAALAWIPFARSQQKSLPKAPATTPVESIAPPIAEADRDLLFDHRLGYVKYLGHLSCAATACHGRTTDLTFNSFADGIRNNEHSIWSDGPHARSLDTLSTDDSKRMLRRLGATDTKGAIDRTGAHYRNCLACHAVHTNGLSVLTGVDPDDTPARPQPRYESVNCEACHGPADAWRAKHFLVDWPKFGDDTRVLRHWQAHKMIRTKNLLVRARLCASCHVGGPDREVNHDLIAAGHPRLNFELAWYHAKYRTQGFSAHWNEVRERRRVPHFEARLWIAGQLASTEASLQLLRARLARVATKRNMSPWPEFAEYNCSACHHGLASPSWRQQRHALGAIPWGTWYHTFGMLQTPGSEQSAQNPLEHFGVALSSLRDVMQKSVQPDPAKTLPLVDEALTRLRAWSESEDVVRWLSVDSSSRIPANRQASKLPSWLLTATARFTRTASNKDVQLASQIDNWDAVAQAFLYASAMDLSQRDEKAKTGLTTNADGNSVREYLQRLSRRLDSRQSNGGRLGLLGIDFHGAVDKYPVSADLLRVLDHLQPREQRQP